jgi:hypothetical protein
MMDDAMTYTRLLSALAVVVALAPIWRHVHAAPEEIDTGEGQAQPSAIEPLDPAVPAPPLPSRVRVRPPIRWSPAAARESGWNAGVGLGAILGGPQLVFLSVYPWRVAVGITVSDVPRAFGAVFIGVGAAMVVAMGATESIVGGIYHSKRVQLRPDGSDAELRRAWNAGLMKATGSVLLIHGALNLVVGGAVLGVAVNRDLGEMTRSLRDISIIGVVLGGLDVIIGGTIAIVGSTRTFSAGRVVLLPTTFPGGAGAMLGGAF